MPEVSVPLSEAPQPAEVKQIEVAGRAPVALYNLDGEFFATDDTCTHGEASLAEGDIDGDEIYCPFHMGAFDIRTGEATVAPCAQALRSYGVNVVGNSIKIEVPE
jgi:nitrite reductase/ring-hydroxylating ferredoxin subunit